MNILSQTTLPALPQLPPGVDPSNPAVKWVLAAVGIMAAVHYVLMPLLNLLMPQIKEFFVNILKSIGAIKRTWREEMTERIDKVEAKAEVAEDKAVTAKRVAVEAAEKTVVVAKASAELIDRNKMVPETTDVSRDVEEQVKRIAGE